MRSITLHITHSRSPVLIRVLLLLLLLLQQLAAVGSVFSIVGSHRGWRTKKVTLLPTRRLLQGSLSTAPRQHLSHHHNQHDKGNSGAELHELGQAAERIARYFRGTQNGPSPHQLLPSAAPKACTSPPNIDFKLLQQELTDKGADTDPARNKLLVLDYVCVDQETIVVYDPAALADEHPHALPSIDLGSIQYFFRHATQAQTEHTLEAVQHLNEPLVAEEQLSSLVSGDRLEYRGLQIRAASSEEVEALASGESPFSRCTVPFVYASHWIHNFAEFFSRAVAWLYVYQEQRKILPRDITLAIYSPAKLPLAPFNIDLLRPFSAYEPVSFADLSSRLPETYPSQSTFEGTHKRCFRKLMVWRDTGGSYPAMPPAGKRILQHYARRVNTAADQNGELWKSSDSNTMRVLIETRPNKGIRQLLGLHALLDACNSWGGTFPGGITSGSERPGFRSVECRPFTFGSRGFVYDLVVMRKADVLVSLHGAGQINSNFMPEHSSLIEVRGNNASQMWMANIWNPLISHQSHFSLFYWGLFLEDPALAEPSRLEGAGLSDTPVLDQNVHLKWEHLLPMLQRVAATNKDAGEFSKLWGAMGDSVVFDVLPGHAELVPHGPLLS